MDRIDPTLLLGALLAGMLIDLGTGTRFLSPAIAAGIVIVLGLRFVRRCRQRRAFAIQHGFRFRTVMPSDAEAPYTHFDRVRRAEADSDPRFEESVATHLLFSASGFVPASELARWLTQVVARARSLV